MSKKLVLICMIIISTILLLACSSGDEQSETQAETKSSETQKLDISVDMLTTPKDLSCGMDLRKHTVMDTAIYNGKLYGFCSEYCKNQFKANPEAALAKLEDMQKSTDEHIHD